MFRQCMPAQQDEGPYAGGGEQYMYMMRQHQEDSGHVFFGAQSTRENEELMRRRAEHSESTEHLVPQQQKNHGYGRTRKCDFRP